MMSNTTQQYISYSFQALYRILQDYSTYHTLLWWPAHCLWCRRITHLYISVLWSCYHVRPGLRRPTEMSQLRWSSYPGEAIHNLQAQRKNSQKNKPQIKFRRVLICPTDTGVSCQANFERLLERSFMWAAVTRRFLIPVHCLLEFCCFCFCVLCFVPTRCPNKMVNLVTQFRSSFLSKIYPTYTSSSFRVDAGFSVQCS
ncbi:Protein of unknown function [Pyronema omphalodes CBS 100304]|uniref:Uncharacterized protein n=1 Tax=Pyronema omphalodes (strain CBS 100304) TaxID=1076935 RepID=U4LKZ6_PYROM|nr:Protein of unknown function [Pyronema omphalodes CBS 100304]